MDLKKSSVFVLVFCGWIMLLAAADPDCENLQDRRDEMEQCCQVGKLIPLDDADDCSSSVDESSPPHEKMMCFIDCKLKSLGVLNGEEFVKEKIDEYVNRLEDGWKDTAKNIATGCVEAAKRMKTKMQERHGGDMKCSPLGSVFMMCSMKHTFEECPQDKWQNTNFCNKIRNGDCFPKRGGQ